MKLKVLMSLAASICALNVIPAAAQEGGTSPVLDKALAAGWKAGFICSATFNAGQALAEIESNELEGIYPDFQSSFETLPAAEIDRTNHIVSVSWSDDLPPRIAVWRAGMGCTQLPIGAAGTMAIHLPDSLHTVPAPRPETSVILSPDIAVTEPKPPNPVLNTVVQTAFDGETFGSDTRTSGVLIARNGTILTEDYARGIDAETPQRTWSVAKSFSASIIGAAVEAGHIMIDDSTGLAAWSAPGDPRGQITLEHLLHMASGLDSGQRGNRTDRTYFGGARVIDDALGHTLEAAPGTRFKYANNDTLLTMRTLREAMADDAAFHTFPYAALLWKIGALRTTLETDWNGDFLSSSLVWTTARDMARLGQLYLQRGMWDGERLLPEGWTDYVATPAPVQPNGGFGYGAQFWLLNKEEGIPSDAYAALGNRGQHLVIVPSLDLLIVRRGYDVNGGGRFDIAAFTRAVIAALD